MFPIRSHGPVIPAEKNRAARVIAASCEEKDLKNLEELIQFIKVNIFRQTLYPLALLCGGAILVVLLYLPTIRAPFILDDLPKIADNSEIRSLPLFIKSLGYSYGTIQYNINHNDPSRPMTYFSYFLNYQLRGLRTGTYHAVNLLLHLGVTFLLFFLIRKISSSVYKISSETIPLLVAILFALHPVQASTVGYIFRRSDLLAAFFYLLSFYFFIYTIERKSRFFLTVSLSAFILSLLSKQSALTLPLILWIYDFTFIADRNLSEIKARARFHRPFWLVLVLYLVWRYFYLGGLGDLEAMERIKPSLYILNQPSILLKYIQILMVPKFLCLDHLIIPETSFFEFKIWFSWGFFLGLLFLIFLLTFIKGWKSKVVQFSLLWFLIQLAPTSSFFPTTRLMVENRIYLAGIGLGVAVLSLFFVLFKLDLKKGFFAKENFMGSLLFFSLLILFSIFTYRRNVVYGNPVYLWREVTKLYPHHTLAYSHLGLAYSMRGDYNKALVSFDQALQLDPHLGEATYNKGNVYLEQESYDNALGCYKKVMELEPQFARSYHNAALIYARRKNFVEAEALYRKTIQLDPTSSEAYYNLGLLYHTQNRYNEALEYYEKAIQHNPKFIQAYYNMGAVYYQMKDAIRALEKFEQALSCEPYNRIVRERVLSLRRQLQS